MKAVVDTMGAWKPDGGNAYALIIAINEKLIVRLARRAKDKT
jgi:hypothetical protein